MLRREARRVYHVARTDLLARLRSRKLLAFLAVVVYFGYLINVGTFGLFYSVEDSLVSGALTAPMTGLNAGVAGSMVTLFGGFYLMRGTIARDEHQGHGPLLATSNARTPVYLLGKLGSNTVIGLLTAAVLAAAAVANHAVHGVGSTDPVAIAWPVFVMVVPLAVLVGGVAILFETIDLLVGTLGRVVYLVSMVFVVGGLFAPSGTATPAAVQTGARSFDLLGRVLAHELTFDAVRSGYPAFDRGFVSFGTGGTLEQTFRYEGGRWPAWFFLQRLGCASVGVVLTVAASVPFTRFRETTPGPVARRVPSVSVRSILPTLPSLRGDGGGSVSPPDSRPRIDELSLTPVEGKQSGGFGRLLAVELRRLLRGHPWWWYLGAVALAGVPVWLAATGTDSGGQAVLLLAAVWPIFVWSRIGAETARAGIIEQIRASQYPVGQLFAEWAAGCLIGLAVTGGAFVLSVAGAGPEVAVGLLGTVLFPPSLALVAGLWTGSQRLFEASYLGVWYLGPLNGAFFADFAGITAESVAAFVPAVYAAVGFLAVLTVAHRRAYDGLVG
ncbi:hypothetical protein [Halobaculum sp. MBLA0143]|uniref:hypothetical protein n=1 Tax=Halobaculum sp. MBLA0143 TaxID=3079933 RepID=UPI0035267E5D